MSILNLGWTSDQMHLIPAFPGSPAPRLLSARFTASVVFPGLHSWQPVILFSLSPPSQPLISLMCRLSVHFSFARCLSDIFSSFLHFKPQITLRQSLRWPESKTTGNITSVPSERQQTKSISSPCPPL